jgi:hypothetical protein
VAPFRRTNAYPKEAGQPRFYTRRSMDWGGPLGDVERALEALSRAQSDVAVDITEGLKLGDRLRDAARSIAGSSSGSWVGWHSRMYYGNYEEPSVQDSWNTEWGGLRGFSPRWQERSLMEVQRAIEERAGVSLGDVGRIADRVREICQPLQQEAITVLSPVCDIAGFGKEAELLARLEKVDWIVAPENFIRALAPSALASRDSQAVMQRMQAPLHLEVEAAIVTNTSTLTTSQKFLADAIRLTRQVRTKLKAMPVTAPGETAIPGKASDAPVQHQLLQRSRLLFAVLAIMIAAADLWLLRTYGHNRLVAASLMIVGALAVAGAYAWLLDRAHVRPALVAGGAVLAALAALDQILGHFLQ